MLRPEVGADCGDGWEQDAGSGSWRHARTCSRTLARAQRCVGSIFLCHCHLRSGATPKSTSSRAGKQRQAMKGQITPSTSKTTPQSESRQHGRQHRHGHHMQSRRQQRVSGTHRCGSRSLKGVRGGHWGLEWIGGGRRLCREWVGGGRRTGERVRRKRHGDLRRRQRLRSHGALGLCCCRKRNWCHPRVATNSGAQPTRRTTRTTVRD